MLICVKVSVPVIMLAFSTKLQPKGTSKHSDFKWDARVCFLSLPPDQNVEIQISTLAAGAAQLWRLPPPLPSKSSHVITSQQSTKRIPPSVRLFPRIMFVSAETHYMVALRVLYWKQRNTKNQRRQKTSIKAKRKDS